MEKKRFVNIKDTVRESDITTYVIVEQFPQIDYSLIYRKSSYEPWVAAYGYRNDGKSWGQGAYFSTISDAMGYIQEKLDAHSGRISYSRMSDIASKAIDGLIQDDPNEAEIYLKETMEITSEEAEYFGIAEQMDMVKGYEED